MGGGGGAHACVCAGGSHHSSTFNEHGKQSNNPTSLQWATHVWRRIASSVLLVVTPRAPVCRDDHDLHGLRLVHGGADPAPACNVGGEPVLVLSAVAVPRVEELVDVGLVWDAGEVDGRRVVAVVVDRTQPASRALAVAPAVKLVLRARVRRERYVPVRGGGRRARSRGRRRSRRERKQTGKGETGLVFCESMGGVECEAITSLPSRPPRAYDKPCRRPTTHCVRCPLTRAAAHGRSEKDGIREEQTTAPTHLFSPP